MLTYVLWSLDKMVQNWIVDQSTARDFTVVAQRLPFYDYQNGLSSIWQELDSLISYCLTYSILAYSYIKLV